MKSRVVSVILLAAASVACSQSGSPVSPSALSSARTGMPSVGMGTSLNGDSATAAVSGESSSLLAGVRQATARYHDVSKAIADGYLPPDPSTCLEVPGPGTMGIHVVHPQLASDQVVDVTRPEVLLYLPKKNGGFRLVGVEYFVPLPGPGSVLTPAPSAFGQRFDGPMEGHEPGMPWHYDLHVWAWAPNPSGTFAQFNPSLSCDAAGD